MKVSKRELQRIIREEKVRLRREDKRSASRKTGSSSGAAGKKSRANRLRRIIREERARLLSEQDAGDVALQKAMEIFGPDALVDEEVGEVIIDIGDDQVVEDMYDQWIAVWPEGMHEEGGLIYTGVMV